MTRLIHHWGELLAAEINEGRRVRAIIDEIAKTKDRSALVISRRAKRFRDECSSSEAQDQIDGAAQKAGLWSTATEFNQLIDAACERDEAACRDLARMAEQLAPICLKSADDRFPWKPAFIFFCSATSKAWGINRAYTYSEKDGNDDFVDPVTQATRLAVNNPRFSPLHANRLRKGNLRPPPMPIRVSARDDVAGLPPRGHIGDQKSTLKL